MCVLRGDDLDAFAQAERIPRLLEQFLPGFAHEHLPRMPEPVRYGDYHLDVSGNPGRPTGGPLMVYWAASP